jgi:hypothetical protein
MVVGESDRVVLSKNSEPLQRAISDLFSCAHGEAEEPPDYEIQPPLVNVFGTKGHNDKGYRTEKYWSNGTAVTVAGDAWSGEITRIHGSNPKSISFAEGYGESLSNFFHKSSGSLPRIDDVAVWYYRGRDLSSILSPQEDGKEFPNPPEAISTLVERFKEELDLTAEEEQELFQSQAELLPDESDNPEKYFSTTVSDPLDYLPGVSQEDEGIEGQESSECSFDLVVSLASRGLAILTGPSGTGKSRSAIQLGLAIKNELGEEGVFLLEEVEADWTDSSHVLGYRNPFGPERTDPETGDTTNETYQVTDALRLFIRAADPEHAGIPHILILDEMNLSHVERYFAPVLSLMEANRSLPREDRESLISPRDMELIAEVLQENEPGGDTTLSAKRLAEEGAGLPLGPNVFVIGTVNVDETTYMFSPKVLDRAHVREVLPVSPSSYISEDEDSGREQLGATTAVQILNQAIEYRRKGTVDNTHPGSLLPSLLEDLEVSEELLAEIRDGIRSVLHGAHKLLDPVGFPCGYRTVNEVFAYVAFWIRGKLMKGNVEKSISKDWHTALDKAVLQKVLPKIHGNRRRLAGSLRALEAFLGGKHEESQVQAAYNLGDQRITVSSEEALSFIADEDTMGHSRQKLRQMNRTLQATGFVSFVN